MRDVALSIHHPPFHSRNTRLPIKRTIVICMHDNEHAASPAMVLLLSVRARYRFGSQMKIIMTSALAEMMREAVEESGSRCNTRLTMAVISVARARRARSTPMLHVPILSTLFAHEYTFIHESSANDIPQVCATNGCSSFLAWLCDVSKPPDDYDSRGYFNARLDAKEYERTRAIFRTKANGYTALCTVVQNACNTYRYGVLLKTMIRSHCGRF